MKSVRIADLKARLSHHLQEVRRGHAITVMDRNTPIARLVPYQPESEPLVVRKPLGRAPNLRAVKLPPALKLRKDVVEYLPAEGQVDR